MNTTAQKELVDAATQAMVEKDHASRHIGMTIDEAGPGQAVTSLTVEEHLLNGFGVCHGGYIFSLADTAMAFASNATNGPALAQTCQVTFLSPSKLGDRLTATAREAARAGRTGIFDVDVRNQDGVLVAIFRGQTRTVERKVAGP